jgi:hypothetical protein
MTQNEDAKLSAAQRKKLKGSTFCGPGRSFPVPDCAHVTAARRLIGRAKVSSSTKSKILSCVSRKAKAMGCGGGDEDEAKIEELINSEEFAFTRELLQFMEDQEKLSEEAQKLDELKYKMAVLLDRVRSGKKEREPSEQRVAIYNNRTASSLIDALIDEFTAK